MNKRSLSFILVSLSILTNSCVDTDRNLYVTLTNEQYFDFNLNKEVTLNIDYGLATKDKDYVVLFELYDQNPLETKKDGTQEKKKDIEPVYRGATDGTGKFSGKPLLLADLSEAWLYCDYPGTVSLVKLEIQNQSLSFDQKAHIASLSAKTRALTSNKHKYPDNWKVLGDWDEYGRPDYLLSTPANPPSNILYNIKDIYSSIPVDKKFIMDRYPQFFDGTMTSDISIIKPTKVRLAFINSTASWNNVVGYFTYSTNNPPTSPKDLQKIIAFPNASPVVKNETTRGALSCNDQIQLKYWNQEKGEFQETFPAGISIGWFLEGMGFNIKNGDVEEKTASARYSITALNQINATTGKQQQYAVSLKANNSNQIVAVGFEDNSDMKFNDACFYVDIEEPDAIDPTTPELPEVDPPKDIQNTISYNGLLTFEDLWPKTGDYDMNDLMIYYNSTVYRTIVGNRVFKIVDEFTPYHDGGNRPNGFGYQLSSLDPNSIKNVIIEGTDPSTHMQGLMLEPGQSHPTILLFDNIKSGVINKKITVTIELNENVPEEMARPPYNPFIFNNTNRGTEVHLPKYKPTSKADESLFGTEGDGSRPGDNLYYVVSRWLPQMPFAINLPGVKNFPIPDEFERISDTYPGFTSWVRSEGKTDKDWYKKPKQN